jgi:hypothetical protein
MIIIIPSRLPSIHMSNQNEIYIAQYPEMKSPLEALYSIITSSHWPVLSKGLLNSRAAVRDQSYRLHKQRYRYHFCGLGTPLTPGWGVVFKAKSLTQSLMPTVGFEPRGSWPLVRDPSNYTTAAPYTGNKFHHSTLDPWTRTFNYGCGCPDRGDDNSIRPSSFIRVHQ